MNAFLFLFWVSYHFIVTESGIMKIADLKEMKKNIKNAFDWQLKRVKRRKKNDRSPKKKVLRNDRYEQKNDLKWNHNHHQHKFLCACRKKNTHFFHIVTSIQRELYVF